MFRKGQGCLSLSVLQTQLIACSLHARNLAPNCISVVKLRSLHCSGEAFHLPQVYNHLGAGGKVIPRLVFVVSSRPACACPVKSAGCNLVSRNNMTRKHCKNCKNPIKGHNGPAGNRCTNAPASDTPAKKGKGRHQSPPPASEGLGDTSTAPGEPVTSQPAGGGKLPDMPSGDVPDVNVSCPTTSSGVGNPSLDASLAVGHVSPANVSVQAPVVSVPSVWSVPDGSGRPGVLSYPYSAWGTAALPPLDVTRSARQHTTPASDSGLTTAQNGLLPIYTRPAGPQNGIIPGCDNYGENMAPVSTHSEGAAGGGVNAHIPVSAHSEGAAGGVNVTTTPQGGYHGYPGGNMFARGGANMPYGFTHPFHNNLNGLYNQLPYAGLT